MIGREISEQVLRALDRKLHERKYGTTAAMHRALGAGKNWWNQRKASREISAGQMFLVLEHLGIDPARFVRDLRGTPGGLALEQPQGEAPEVVRLAWERCTGGTPGDMGRGYLEELDRLRYRQPEEAVARATEVVRHVELEQLPLLLGVAGSAYRLWEIQLDAAQHAIQAGIEIARSQDNSPAVGDLLQRLAYVVGDRGQFQEALEIVQQASLIHLVDQNLEAVGKTLVDQGMFLFYLEEYPESIRRNEAALHYLPGESKKNRFSALQTLGLACQKLEDLEQATTFASRAETLLQDLDLGPWPRAKLLWLQAEISTARGHLAEAEKSLQEVVTIFSDIHPGETALATAWLVRVQLMAGRRQDACQTARTMYRLVEPLRKNPIVSAALADLLRVGEAGLTLELAEQVIAKMEAARERRDWRSPQKTA